jgi:hypothetical protein
MATLFPHAAEALKPAYSQGDRGTYPDFGGYR